MANILSKFCIPSRLHPLLGGNGLVVFPVRRNDGTPGWDHPAAPAPALCPGLSHRDLMWLPLVSCTQWGKSDPNPQGMSSTLGSLHLLSWKDPAKKPLMSALNSMPFEHSRTINVLLPGRKFTLPCSQPEHIVRALKPVPFSTVPLPCSKEMEVRVQEKPRKGMSKIQEDHIETNGQDYQNSGDGPLTSRALNTNGVLISLKGGPGPLDPKHGLSEKVETSPMSSSSEGQAVTYSPTGNVLTPTKPDSEAAGLSAPTPCCSLLQDTSRKEVLGEDHSPSNPGTLMSDEEMHGKKPLDIPSGSSSSLVSVSSKPSKRKISIPLSLPLPPLLWGRCELPVPCKLPRLSIDKNLDTLENTKCQWNKIEDETKVVADCPAITSIPVLSGSAKVSTVVSSQPTSDSDVIDMDTTPPCHSIIYRSFPDSSTKSLPCSHECPSVDQRHPVNFRASSTGPPAFKYLRLTPKHLIGPQTTSPVTDTDAMDTTPSSYAVIF